MPLSLILVVALSGALLLFAVVTGAVVFHVKRRNQYRKQQQSEVPEHGYIRSIHRTTMRSVRTPEICFPRRMSRGLSFNPWVTLDGSTSNPAHEWEDVDLTDRAPPLATAKRLSFHRRVSRVRESWPLSTKMPIKLLPTSATMVPNSIAPPGYVVQDPKRQSIKLVRRRESSTSRGDSHSKSPTRATYPVPLYPHDYTQRRSVSETPTIHRSASQRLKAVHRKSLTRTLTTLNRYSGRSPTERLPTPPRKQSASREQLINQEFDDAMGRSLRNSATCRLVTDTSTDDLALSHAPRPPSPAFSFGSSDSLCETSTPEAILLEPLSSPSKLSVRSDRSEKRYKLRMDDEVTIASSEVLERPESLLVVAKPADSESPKLCRHSLSGDPFYSSVRSSKTIASITQVQGPRPLYFRKSTFGHESSPTPPDDYTSPKTNVSGNEESPSVKYPVIEPMDEPELNPFRWSPQEAIKTRLTPLSGRTSPNRKGHRRSNVIRMSNLSLVPRTSTVDPVPEESEEESPRKSFRFSLPPATAIRVFEPEKSPSPASSVSSRRRSMRPPSSATFSPDLTNLTEGIPTTPNSSPASKIDSRRSFSIYSPTLSVCNYYAESGGSEDEFFKGARASTATMKSRRNGRDYSANHAGDLKIFSTSQTQPNPQLSLTRFPEPPTLAKADMPVTTVLTPPPIRPLPTIASTLKQSQHTTLQTISPIPIHPTTSQLHVAPLEVPTRTSTISPPRDSLASSISMLRRMNSQISVYSSQSTIAEESPQLPTHKHVSLDFNLEEAQAEERGRSRGSRHYLAIGRQSQYYIYNRASRGGEGQFNQGRMSRVGDGKRDSHRIHKDRRKRYTQDFEREEKELTPVPECGSPATGANALGIIGLRYPLHNRESYTKNSRPRNRVTSISSPLFDAAATSGDISDAKLLINVGVSDNKENFATDPEASRWTDTISKPTISNTNSVRRDNMLQEPIPHTPPKWSAAGLGRARERLLQEGIVEGEFGSLERSGSVGLYDQEGFLKSSPELRRIGEERVRERERESERRSRVVSRNWTIIP